MHFSVFVAVTKTRLAGHHWNRILVESSRECYSVFGNNRRSNKPLHARRLIRLCIRHGHCDFFGGSSPDATARIVFVCCSHQCNVGFSIGQAFRQTLPTVNRTQFHGPAQCFGKVVGQRAGQASQELDLLRAHDLPGDALRILIAFPDAVQLPPGGDQVVLLHGLVYRMRGVLDWLARCVGELRHGPDQGRGHALHKDSSGFLQAGQGLLRVALALEGVELTGRIGAQGLPFLGRQTLRLHLVLVGTGTQFVGHHLRVCLQRLMVQADGSFQLPGLQPGTHGAQLCAHRRELHTSVVAELLLQRLERLRQCRRDGLTQLPG